MTIKEKLTEYLYEQSSLVRDDCAIEIIDLLVEYLPTVTEKNHVTKKVKGGESETFNELVISCMSLDCPERNGGECKEKSRLEKETEKFHKWRQDTHCTFCGYPKKGNGCRECKPSEEKSWVGEFAPNGGHDPHNPFPPKPSVQANARPSDDGLKQCEHKNSSYDVTTGWRCEDCKTLSWFKPKEKSNLLKPKPKFEIEELKYPKWKGSETLDEHQTRLIGVIGDKINQIIKYLREHHELTK